MSIVLGLMIPFLGTLLGSACVFFMKKDLKDTVKKLLLGFASGVMVAASIWSLLIPSLNESASMGSFSWVPAAIGFLLGILFLLALDSIIPHLHPSHDQPEGMKSNLHKSSMLVFAVTLHNIPEGMAVGIVFAGMLANASTVTFAQALVLSIGIAIQNFPEGAIISMPLKETGISKVKAFIYGTLSGIVEPIAGALTIFISASVSSCLPYILSFAAGAMMYVVVEELIPETAQGKHSNLGTVGFAIGFVLMMILDTTLG